MGTTIIEFIFILIAHASAGIYSSTLKYKKSTTYIIWGIWIVCQGILLSCSELMLKNVALQFVLSFGLSFIGQYVIFFATTKGRLSQRIFTMLTYSIMFCILMTLYTIVSSTLGGKFSVLLPFIMAVMLFIALYYFLVHICPLCQLAAKNIINGWNQLILVNVVFLITVILSSVFPVRLTHYDEPTFIPFIFISVSIVSVYPVIFSFINNMSEVATKREVERQNKLLLAHIEMENMQLMADSQARHDRRHHNLVMLEFAKMGDINSLREYLNNLMDSERELCNDEKYCDNKTANTVLTVYERNARDKDIFVKVLANVSRDINILTQDIVIVIANLFENAINATKDLKNKKKYVDISIKESEKRLLIRIENSCVDNMKFDESFYGIGINSVITTVSKYDGMYDFSVKNDIFIARICMNLK